MPMKRTCPISICLLTFSGHVGTLLCRRRSGELREALGNVASLQRGKREVLQIAFTWPFPPARARRRSSRSADRRGVGSTQGIIEVTVTRPAGKSSRSIGRAKWWATSASSTPVCGSRCSGLGCRIASRRLGIRWQCTRAKEPISSSSDLRNRRSWWLTGANTYSRCKLHVKVPPMVGVLKTPRLKRVAQGRVKQEGWVSAIPDPPRIPRIASWADIDVYDRV